MRFVVIDFETLFSSEYSLSRMSTEAYVRDSRFEAHGAAIKWSPDHAAKWYDERYLRQVLKEENWEDVLIVAHHCQFDGLILSRHYAVVPKMYGCTLSMARLLLGNHTSVSLDSVRSRFRLPAKCTPYSSFRGKHWSELDTATQSAIAGGCVDEVESIWKIFLELGKSFPREEYEIVDETIRMFTQPVLRADTDLLAALWQAEEKRKRESLEALAVSAADLQSAGKFRALLESEGVEVSEKAGKNGNIPAFAKTDEFMRDLLEDDNERVRALAAARIGVKGTLLQTRAETLGWMASRGPLPVYLRYCGAHTTRWSGGDSCNWQNFKRGSSLRKAIYAPEGYLLGIIDLSQIECRILNYLAGQWDVIEKFKRGEDPYVGIASAFYGRSISKADANERGTGKQAELSCGYGCGDAKFRATAKLGIYGPPVELSYEEAQRFVDLYRSTHQAVVAYWKEASRMISRLAGGPPCQWGPMVVRDGRIYLPNGAPMDYTTLEYHKDQETGDAYWRVLRRQKQWSKLYGGKLVENVVQALARVVLSQAMLRIRHLGFRTVMTSHDELVILIPNAGYAPTVLDKCKQEMVRTPDWLPGIPLDAEATLSERYAK
jgi:DNA polymerase family A